MANQPGNPNMTMLIPMINELQRIFTTVNTKLTLTLPQIAVIGSQSAGKSSVLENIVGRDFLPRGDNMVTKRPLVLQLVTYQGAEYGVFSHKPQQRFVNYADIRQEIENDTKAVVRDGMGVSNMPINLTIYSPHVVNLTLVDLPGMVKVPSQGQPHDISKRIDDIILEYISNENCLILAVTPANIDLVTSDALVMARSRDPMGRRTIGVLTKLDMMGRGHNARDVLLNKVVVLERGFIGVVLRGRRVDEYGRTMKELDIPGALEFERQFFLTDPAYSDIADRLGVPYLQRTLSIQLTEHILKCLPDLKRELQERFRHLDKEVSEFRTSSMLEGSGFDQKALVVVTHEYQEEFDGALRGNHLKESHLKNLTGGARIATIFKYRFPSELTRVDLQDKDMRNQIIYVIKNIRGIRPGLFTPDEAFEYTVKIQIAKFEEPIIKCVDMVVNDLKIAIHEVTSKFKRYPFLQKVIEELLMNFLKEREIITKEACSLFVNTQLSYINTTHEDFIGFANAERSANSNDVTRSVSNQTIRKGFLRMSTGGKIFQGSKYFFVLTTDNLSWYSDADEREKKYMLHLENLRRRDADGGFMGKRAQFTLYNVDGRNVYKEHRLIELSADSKEETESWRDAFTRAGIFGDRAQRPEATPASTENSSGDPHMERQVETINILVTSYMKIVTKMTRDFIPKLIVHNIIKEIQSFIAKELLLKLYTVPDPKALLQESAEERQRRATKIAEFEAVKSALCIIDSFYMNARKVTTTMTPSSSLTANFSSTSRNNNFGQSPNMPTTQVDRSLYANTNLNQHSQSNHDAWNDFGTRAEQRPAISATQSTPTYVNGFTTRSAPTIPQRPLPPVPPRPFEGSPFS